MVALRATARPDCRSMFECTKTLQTLITCGNLLKNLSRSSVVTDHHPTLREFWRLLQTGDLQQAAAETETSETASYHSEWSSPSSCDCSSGSQSDNGQKPGAIEPERPQQSRRGNAWQKSVLTLDIHLLRLVVQVFRQYEKHNVKKETEYHHIKIVCDSCFKYLVNEKKVRQPVFICLVLWREASVFLNALVLHFRRGMQSFFDSF